MVKKASDDQYLEELFGGDSYMDDLFGEDPPDSKSSRVAEPAVDPNHLHLEGVVSRVVFNKDGFAIFVLQGTNKQITVKGPVTSIAVGMRVTVSGLRTSDPKYGNQLTAHVITPVVPNLADASKPMSSEDNAEMVSYLGSGILPWVGEKTAQMMMKKYGQKLPYIIEHEPVRLTEIRGITQKKAEEIRTAWIDNLATHEIFLFLNAHGLSLLKARDIVRHFGVKADALMQRIKENPYIICEVDGVGFKTADSLAATLGMKGDHPERIRHGIEYAFLEDIIKNGGSTGATEMDVCKHAMKLLEVPLFPVARVLADMLQNDKRLLLKGEIVYLRSYYKVEQEIAQDLARLMSANITPLPDMAERIARAEARMNIELSESQRRELWTVLNSPVAVLTGFPGTGKTTILSVLLAVLKESGEYPAILQAAPSATAAKRMQKATHHAASTCHRALGFEHGDFVHNRDEPLPSDMVTLDEWSMGDVLLTRAVLAAIPTGCKLLLVGDVDQLPSVGAGRVFADMIDSGRIPTGRLTEIRRQGAGSRISICAKQVNAGIIPNDFGEDMVLHKIKAESEDENIATGALNKILSMIAELPKDENGAINMDNIQILSPIRGGDCGTNRLNAEIQKLVNPNLKHPERCLKHFDRTFALGDRVMQLKNDYDLNIFNGDTGKIVHVNQNDRSALIDFGDQTVEISSTKIDKLELCYASTVHKSQGSEYPEVIIPVINGHWMMLKRDILYTAITRGRNKVTLVTDAALRALRTAVTTTDSARRVTSLKDHLIELCSPISIPEMPGALVESVLDDVPL